MSLDFSLEAPVITSVYEGNITHNLGVMAAEAGIYQVLWRPDEFFGRSPEAWEIIPILEAGIKKLQSEGPEKFRHLEPENKWGTYEILLQFAKDTLAACRKHPEAKVSVYR